MHAHYHQCNRYHSYQAVFFSFRYINLGPRLPITQYESIQCIHAQCKSSSPKSTSPNISGEGIYSLVFDALPNGASQTVVSGRINVL